MLLNLNIVDCSTQINKNSKNYNNNSLSSSKINLNNLSFDFDLVAESSSWSDLSDKSSSNSLNTRQQKTYLHNILHKFHHNKSQQQHQSKSSNEKEEATKPILTHLVIKK